MQPIVPRYWLRRDRPNPHVIIWQVAGRRHFRSFATKALAMTWAQELVRCSVQGAAVSTCGPTWDTAVMDFRSAKAARSDCYRAALARTLTTLRMFYEARHGRTLRYVGEITPELLDLYFAAYRARQALPWVDAAGGAHVRQPTLTEAAKDYRHLRAFFRLMVRRRRLAFNPLESIDMPRPPAKRPQVPSTTEWLDLLAAIPTVGIPDPQAWHVLILLAGTTGIDRDDLLRFTVTTVQVGGADEEHYGLIEWSRAKRAATAHTNIQYHALPPEINNRVALRVASLLEYGGTALFPWHSFPTYQWDRIRAAASFNYPFKALRRITATRAAEQQALQAAAEELGHSNLQVTRQHYADPRRVQLALVRARRAQLPPLPPLPPFVPSTPRHPRADT